MTEPDDHVAPVGAAAGDATQPLARGGGPLRTRQGEPGAEVPSAVLPNRPASAESGSAGDTRSATASPRYARSAITPLPFGVVSVAAFAAAWWSIGWASDLDGADEPLRSEWWATAVAVLVPSEAISSSVHSPLRMWVAIGLMVATLVAVAAWIGRLGYNVRAGNGPFGGSLALLALPAWWTVPLVVGVGDDGLSQADAVIRHLLAVGLFVVLILLVRWPLLNRIWRSGRLPFDVASIALWAPNAIAWAMLLGSSTFTQIAAARDGRGESSWETTDAMGDWITWTTRASAAGLLVLLVVVSVLQHAGIRQDVRDDDAARLR